MGSTLASDGGGGLESGINQLGQSGSVRVDEVLTEPPEEAAAGAGEASHGGPAIPSNSRLLGQIFEVFPGGIVQVSPIGEIVAANAQAQQLLGLSWDQLSRLYVADFQPETISEDGTAFAVEDYPVSRCLMTGQAQPPATIGVRQPSGDLRWAIFTALPLPMEGFERPGAVVTFVDITERKRDEERVSTQARLRSAIRLVQAGDADDAAGMIFEEPLRIFVETTSSALGFIASIDADAEALDELRVHSVLDLADTTRSMTTPLPIDAESAAVKSSGKLLINDSETLAGGGFGGRRCRRHVLLPLSSGDKVVGLVGLADAPSYSEEALAELKPLLQVCADLVFAVEERREKTRLLAQLAQAERLASVGTLAAGMAHEINNPLAFLLLNLEGQVRHTSGLEGGLAALPQVLGRYLEPSTVDSILGETGLHGASQRFSRMLQHGEDAAEGATRVQRIVRELMTFSRVGDEREGLVDINASVEAALKMSHHEIKYRAELVRRLSSVDPVIGHDGRLSQVFLNLLLNAARAIDEGAPEENAVRVRTWMVDDWVRIEITDTGVGVPPENLHRLFEPFFTTRAAGVGSGLGLSICLNVVRAHGGDIEVFSEVGVGTRFVVSLPRAEREEVESLSAPPPPMPSQPVEEAKRLRMLLIDDDAMVRRVLGHLLSHSYDVVSVDGLQATVHALHDEPAFDLVLCDMMMLDGTGADVHKWLTGFQPSLCRRMIFMTGGTFTPKARKFLAEVEAFHLTKPFTLSELEEVIGELRETLEDEEQ